MEASKNILDYFEELDKRVKEGFDIATEARKKGYDPSENVEITLARNMAERVEGLITSVAPQIKGSGVVERLGELEKGYGRQDWRVALKIAEEIAMEKFCKFNNKKEAMEVGIRVGIAYVTVGVVASPLEGFTRLEIKKRKDDGKEYFCLYFSGPIRSAGGTGASVSVLIGDYVRKKMGYNEYDPTEEEVKRIIIELRDYHERVTNLQYFPSEEELDFMVENLPVQINGDPSEKYEVSNYKDLDRIETNILRNGVCLVFGEGLCQKAAKLWKQLSKWGKDFDLGHWKFLDKFLSIQKRVRAKGKIEIEDKEICPDYTYIKDLVAGRPVLSHPLAKGGFRLRYGRSRISGLSSASIHPATMVVLDGYIANGTQLKMERPGKGSAVMSCDSIEGPIVRLKDGSVLMLESEEKARDYLSLIDEILFLGDILINYGDFFNRAHKLVRAGYCEEWWFLEFEKAIQKKGILELSELLGVEKEFLKELFKGNLEMGVEEAFRISKELKIPLLPKYTYHWKDISKRDLLGLLKWLEKAVTERYNGKVEKIIVPLEIDLEVDAKRVLELLGVPHIVVNKEFVVIEKNEAKSLAISLGFYERDLEESFGKIRNNKGEDILEILNDICDVRLMDKSGIYIGARMGRPEKAKMRKLTGSPHGLFPVGSEGGRLRCFQEALEKGKIRADFPSYLCENCSNKTIFPVCEICNNKTRRMYYCRGCGKDVMEEMCEQHGKCICYSSKSIDIDHYFRKCLKNLGLNNCPDLIKGVRGTSNEDHIPEHLTKSLLRAIEDVYVNKDGTIRYDMTELPITHFKAREIGVSVNKLKELGYSKDVNGNELESEEQIIELMPQDVILPACDVAMEEGADEVLFRVSKFVDNLLGRLYGMKGYYNLEKKEDLVGHLVLAMSPHTSAGALCRIIGFSKLQAFLAHPLLHSLMRRDCLCYDTNIPIYDGKNWKNIKIGELVESLEPDKKLDIYGTLGKKVSGLYTLGVNSENGKIEKVAIREFTKHPKRKIYNLKLENGRDISATGSHRFFVVENGKKIKKGLNDIKLGDSLVIPYCYNVEERDIGFIDLIECFRKENYLMIRNITNFVRDIVKEIGGRAEVRRLTNLTKSTLDNYLFRDSYPVLFLASVLAIDGKSFEDLPEDKKIGVIRDNISIFPKIPLNKDVLRLIGLYVAEGYSRKKLGKKGFYQVYFSVSEKELREFVIEVMKIYFNLNPSYIREDSLTFSSRLLYEFFVNVLKCGSIASEKRIPEIFLNLNKKKLKYFLQGYFDGDGGVSKTDLRVTCDTISERLIYDLDFVFGRFGIFLRKYYYKKKHGSRVKDFYIRKKREIPEFGITKLIVPNEYCKKFYEEIGFGLSRKKEILEWLVENKKCIGMRIEHDEEFVYPKIEEITEEKEDFSYCLNVENHAILANNLLVENCDGDEACVVLLMDALLNFSRKLLPGHRGARQDAPLVLTTNLIPGEVDDMVFDMDVVWRYPLEFYEACDNYKNPWDVKITQLSDRLGGEKQYEDYGFTHSVKDINQGIRCSSYKSLPTMQEKVYGQMDLAEKIRAVDEVDVARLVIERHFMRDIRGNLRKFSQQQFRCVQCNEKYRRPPLIGQCVKCGGRIIFTIAEGSIVKYMEPAISLVERYNLPNYLKQTLELTKRMVESVFSKDSEKQEGLGKWF